MDDINKPISPVSNDDSDRLRIQRIERYKSREDSASKYPSDNSKKNKKKFLHYCFFALKKILDSIVPSKHGIDNLLSPDAVLVDIETLKDLLSRLRDENPYQDVKFAEKFSNAWHNLVQHYIYHDRTKEPTAVDLTKVKNLIHAMKHYPPNEDHSLAFYLQKLTESEWFPAPFFKIIKKLHDDFFTKGKNSELDLWISLIHEILEESYINLKKL